MPSLDAMIAVALAGLALSATPGPSMLYVLSRTVGQSRAAGLASALGLCLGGIVLAVASALGLAAVFQQSDWLVAALRYIGSAYLIWLGLDMIRSAKAESQVTLDVDSVQKRSLGSIIWQGVVVEVLNPKTVLFFALFLPPFIHAGDAQGAVSSVTLQLLVLGALVPLTAIPSDLVVAYMGGTMTRVLNRQKAMRERTAWAGGLILIGIALNLHLQLL
ncbi:LysE family translocator [Donghicola eburneus]|uniref:LysE family translocator n=1 Tax=Donghicola eburneus TaxID=393278 RepID=UPI0008E41BBD|nr:LysE family translocator [Donghicola eburneus]SFQ66587.1 Threonine/homoserine/homoserine lactone efflux protein [Donghicola eburneus]